jgi:hypothetical protein
LPQLTGTADNDSSDFPKILLGPILRRVEEKQVCIWVACDMPVRVKAEVYRFSDLQTHHEEGEQSSAIGLGTAKSVRLGEHLHIALVIARPITAAEGSQQNQSNEKMACFPNDILLAYDIEIAKETNGGDRSKGKRLAGFGLTSGKNSVVYSKNTGNKLVDKDEDLLPTFFIRGKHNGAPLNILHGSCRKLHGKGEDCLAAADELLTASWMDLSSRPCALFLTGDQIYADDVAAPLAPYLTELGIQLLGWEERIAGVNRRLSELKPGQRQKVIKKFAKFTAGHAGNHLLGFGEFAAMYLLAWNAENWPKNLEITPQDRNLWARIKCKAQFKQLEDTRKALAAVRRVLANIPTYMIFDDHEITDDWNITMEWHDNVTGSDCGKQIVTNGLIAYWAFQAWGNDPTLFNDDFIRRVTEYLGKNGSVADAERVPFEDFLWNFHGWTFSAPTNPLAICVDCRTQRKYATFKGAPQLIGEEGLLSVSRTLEDAHFSKGDPVIVVVPSPVLGFYLIELLQKIFAFIISVYVLDLESWYANTAGRAHFLMFLLQMLRPRHCMFLSGDVHFAFTIKAAFAPLQDGYGYDDIMSITQLTSSALKTTSLVKIAFVSEILGRIRQIFPFKRLVRTGRLDRIESVVDRRHPDWVEARSIVRPSGSVIAPLLISDNNLGLVTIGKNMTTITHKLLVRKRSKQTKVHEAAIKTEDGKSPLEDSVKAKVSQYLR